MKFIAKIFLAVIFLIILINHTYSQIQEKKQISLLQLLEETRFWRQNLQLGTSYSENSPKCALNIAFDIIKYFEFMSDAQKKIIQNLLEPPIRQKSKTAGYFTVYYDTSGYHTPSLLTPEYRRMLADTNFVKTHEDSIRIIENFIDSTLYYFNFVLNQVVNVHNYLPPPLETGFDKYNIYITELGGGLYGQTVPLPTPINPGQNPPRYSTYIEIDNDYISVYPSSRGVAGLKVTAAHELHHAIQLGSYGYRENDRYFYEITSTWMEDLIFDEVNDYYQYIKTPQGKPRGHFANPEYSFISTDGLIEYSRAIFGKFLQERYSPIVLKNTWDIMKNQLPYKVASIYSLNQALIQHNSSLRLAFTEFTRWNYYTADRSISNRYYREARFYPLIKSKPQIEVIGGIRNFADSLQNFSTLYLPVKYNNENSTIILNNINQDVSLTGNIINFKFTLQLITTSSTGDKEILPGLFGKLIVNDPENWNYYSISYSSSVSTFASPNPYIIGEGGKIKFTIPARSEEVQLTILNSDMSLVYRNNYKLSDEENTIEWDARNENGNFVNTGVYIYIIYTKSKNYFGKVAIIKK